MIFIYLSNISANKELKLLAGDGMFFAELHRNFMKKVIYENTTMYL